VSSTDQPTTPAQPTPPPAYGPPPTTYTGAVGQTRGTGISMLLYIVTLSIYGFVYYFKTHDEMKKHSGQGLGGAVALILAIFVGFVLPFTMASEVGNLYKRAGREAPVSGVTGLWILLPLVGAIVWFVKTNGALNAYWESLGAPRA
jgi:membrane protease YdiL (CAAX protease family)